jgi:hypothetical protein
VTSVSSASSGPDPPCLVSGPVRLTDVDGRDIAHRTTSASGAGTKSRKVNQDELEPRRGRLQPRPRGRPASHRPSPRPGAYPGTVNDRSST